MQLIPKKPVLLVVPGDLHHDLILDAGRLFKIKLHRLDSQETFLALCRQGAKDARGNQAAGKPLVPPGFYLTSYTELTSNGVQDLPDVDKWDPMALLQMLCLPMHPTTRDNMECAGTRVREHDGALPASWPGSVHEFFALRDSDKLWGGHYGLLGLSARTATLAKVRTARDNEFRTLDSWSDHKAAANARAEIVKASQILENICPEFIPSPSCHPVTPPSLPSVNISGSDSGLLFSCLSPGRQSWIIREFLRRKIEEYRIGIGTWSHTNPASPNAVPSPRGEGQGEGSVSIPVPFTIKCVAYPSLSDLSWNAFDVVSIDEGVKIKGFETIVGEGVRQMDPAFRQVCTATPIKNRLPDVFSLGWWAAGGRADPHPRFPYAHTADDRNTFIKQFQVQAEIERDGKPARHQVTAQVCSIHLLWKIWGPLILRMRKEDCGEDIVPRVRKIIRCKLGTRQRDVYQYHLDAAYMTRDGMPDIGSRLQALRQASTAPAVENLREVVGGATKPCPDCSHYHDASPSDSSNPQSAIRNPQSPYEIDLKTLHAGKRCPTCRGAGQVRLPHKSTTNYVPKIATVLSLIQEVLDRGEQVLVAGAFNEPNDVLSHYLTRAGVRHLVLDGRKPPKKRGKLAAHFKAGRSPSPSLSSLGSPLGPSFASCKSPDSPSVTYPVCLAGADSMAEGHSFHRCNNVILYCYTWAYDKFKQILDRVHRLTSEKPINVYVVLCDGTIDGRLEQLTNEKSDASDLVLDGRLITEQLEEISFAELLRVAHREFRGSAGAETVDEDKLLAEWPALRDRLHRAALAWDIPSPSPERGCVASAVPATSRSISTETLDAVPETILPVTATIPSVPETLPMKKLPSGHYLNSPKLPANPPTLPTAKTAPVRATYNGPLTTDLPSLHSRASRLRALLR